MASKTVTRIQATAKAVEAAAATHADEVMSRLAPLLTPDGPTDLATLQRRLGEILQDERQALQAADAAHIEEQRDDIRPRKRRDAAVAVLHDRVSRARGAVEMTFGAGASNELFAIKGLTSHNPEDLLRQAEQILTRLRDDPPLSPEPGLEGVALDPQAWVTVLEPAHAELVAALAEVHADRRRAERTFRLKHEALARHNTIYSAVTAVLGGLYRLAGLEVYEERLRPVQPQSSGGGAAVPEEEPALEPPVPFPQPPAGGETPTVQEPAPAALPRRVA